MPWPAITARWSPPHPHLSSYAHTRTTPLPHTGLMHVSDIQQVCMDTAWTHLQEEASLCSHTVHTCWTRHLQTKTPGFFLLSSFYPLYQNFKDFCSLLVCAYCICQHLVSCGHCFWILLISVGFILHVGWERRGGVLSIVCFLQWGFKLFIGRSIHLLLGTL